MATPRESRLYCQRRRGYARYVQLRGTRFKRRQEMPVLDIVAKGVEPDFGRLEQDLRRPKQPSRVVDEAKFPQRRRLRQAALPHAQCCQGGDRAGEQRGGAVIRFRRRRDQKRFHARRSQRDCAHKTGRAAAHHGNLGSEGACFSV